jgi:hypothetical protein
MSKPHTPFATRNAAGFAGVRVEQAMSKAPLFASFGRSNSGPNMAQTRHDN